MDTLNDNESFTRHILEITFKEDFTAKLKLSDAEGTQYVTGKWNDGMTNNSEKIQSHLKKAFGDLAKISGDGMLEYSRNGMGMNIVSFSMEKSATGAILKIGETYFEKK